MTFVTPFSLSPDPAYLYLTPNLDATLHKCRYTIDYRQGLSCILGDVGVGKSTILRTVYNEYAERDDVVTVMIPSPNFATDFALVKSLCLDMGLAPRRSMLDQEGELRAFLINLYAEGKNAVVLIDEAQRLTGKMLEVVRVLLNFETDNAKLVQIILAAQLELRDKLKDASKKAIRSRIFAPSLLAPLTLDETAGMIEFRCSRFGTHNPFGADAVQAIYEASGGVPREALKICSIAWDMARLRGVESVPPEAIQAAAAELAMA
ncbi:MAG TPA: AAA family ATPase [Blastocatellia bacterium]|nr:AAA family ATPase [Blastocatellia bacterium]